jgi:glycosyltransferase involved in cell wall biosynthesis
MQSSRNNYLFVIQNDMLGGAEQLLRMLCLKVSKEAQRVDVVILREPMQRSWDKMPENVFVRYLNARSYFPGVLILIPKLYALSRRTKYSITFSSNININGLLGWMKGWKGIGTDRLIIRETTSVFLRASGFRLYFHQLKYWMGYSNADMVICQTEIMRTQFLNHFTPSLKWPLEVIHNPVNMNLIRRQACEPIELFPIEGEWIVTAGRMIHEKGFDMLLHALVNIAEARPNTNLLILGDGPERNNLEELIQKLGLNGRVFMPGFVQNPMPYFSAATICVVSSRIEGFPNVLLQMMTLHDRVVSTLCAGGIESIPGITTCATNDSKALSDSIANTIDRFLPLIDKEAKDSFLRKNDIEQYWDGIKRALVKVT